MRRMPFPLPARAADRHVVLASAPRSAAASAKTMGYGMKTALLFLLALLLAGPVLARGPWRASEENTRGWRLMTPEERIEHQARIRGFKNYEACRTYQLEHHRLMMERARQRGMALRGGGRDICAHLKSGETRH